MQDHGRASSPGRRRAPTASSSASTLDGTPLYALHSRVDGVNHGIVAAVEMDGALYALAKGPGRLLRMPLAAIEKELRA